MKYLIALCLLFVAACDCSEVDYEFKNGGDTLACHGYDDISEYDDGYCKIVSCVWYCNSYQGSNCAYVDITFSSCDGESWGRDYVFIEEEGICGS